MYQRYQNRVELTWPETGLTWTIQRRLALHARNASTELPQLADGGPGLRCAAAPCAAPRFPAKIGAGGSRAAPRSGWGGTSCAVRCLAADFCNSPAPVR